MAHKSPLARVKDQHGDKAKLVAAVEKLTGDDLWVSRTNKNKGLAHVSNAKLLRLHAIFTEVKAKFGTREKLIDAIVELEKRTKDAGYRQHLSAWPVPRLYDAYKATAKRLAPKAAPGAAKAARAGKPAAHAAPAAKAAKPAKTAAAKTAKA
ncbi:MAG: hypothetical protein ACRELB_15695 [Polyangiaceae bacterium]